MEEIGRLIKESYFSLVFMLLAQSAAAVIAVKRRNASNELRNFHYYPIAGCLQAIISLLGILVLGDDTLIVTRYSISLFVVIEFLAIYLLEFRIIVLPRERLLLKVLFGGFILYVICMWVFTDAFYRYYQIFFIQSLILLVPAILYFLQIFRLPSDEDLRNQPGFWVNIGILFLFSSSIPLFLLEIDSRYFINHNRYLYSINYIAYGIFYLFICKAYICRTATKLNYSLS